MGQEIVLAETPQELRVQIAKVRNAAATERALAAALRAHADQHEERAALLDTEIRFLRARVHSAGTLEVQECRP